MKVVLQEGESSVTVDVSGHGRITGLAYDDNGTLCATHETRVLFHRGGHTNEAYSRQYRSVKGVPKPSVLTPYGVKVSPSSNEPELYAPGYPIAWVAEDGTEVWSTILGFDRGAWAICYVADGPYAGSVIVAYIQC